MRRDQGRTLRAMAKRTRTPSKASVPSPSATGAPKPGEQTGVTGANAGLVGALERLVAFRGPKSRRLTLADQMDTALRDLARQRSSLGACARAWDSVIPPEMAAKTRLESLERGTLVVTVSDAATKYLLDRALRSGAERAVIAASSTPVRRVRVEVRGGSGFGQGKAL